RNAGRALSKSWSPSRALAPPCRGLGDTALRDCFVAASPLLAMTVGALRPPKSNASKRSPSWRGPTAGRSNVEPTSTKPVTSAIGRVQNRSGAQQHRAIHHLAVDRDRPALRGLRRGNHAPRPGDLLGGRTEDLVHQRHLLRMNAELRAEAEPSGAFGVRA